MELLKSKSEILFGINFVKRDLGKRLESNTINEEEYWYYKCLIESAELALDEIDTLSVEKIMDNGCALQRLANKNKRYGLVMDMLKNVAKYYRDEYIRKTDTIV